MVNKLKTSSTQYHIFVLITSILGIISISLNKFIPDNSINKNIFYIPFIILLIEAIFLIFIVIISFFKILKNKNTQTVETINTGDKIPVSEAIISVDDYKLLKSVKQAGIEGIRKNNDLNYTSVVKKLKNAKRSIKIIAYFGDAILNGLKSTLLEKLNNGDFEIKVLTSRNDPDYEDTPENYKLIQEVQELEVATKGFTKHNDVENCIAYLRKKINENRKIEVGYYNTQVRYAAIIIDKKWAWWTPYHPGFSTGACISFELADKGEGSIFHLCNKHFDKLWEISEKDEKK